MTTRIEYLDSVKQLLVTGYTPELAAVVQTPPAEDLAVVAETMRQVCSYCEFMQGVDLRIATHEQQAQWYQTVDSLLGYMLEHVDSSSITREDFCTYYPHFDVQDDQERERIITGLLPFAVVRACLHSLPGYVPWVKLVQVTNWNTFVKAWAPKILSAK